MVVLWLVTMAEVVVSVMAADLVREAQLGVANIGSSLDALTAGTTCLLSSDLTVEAKKKWEPQVTPTGGHRPLMAGKVSARLRPILVRPSTKMVV